MSIGIEIDTISNGYVVTGHKMDGYNRAATDKVFYGTFEELVDNLPNIVRQSFDLVFPEDEALGVEFSGLNILN